MRLFVAVPLPPDVAAAGAAALAPSRALRPVRPELMHLTLAFLGAVPDARLADAIAAVQAASAGHRAFAASIDRVGRFPEKGPPRVVWLGVGEGATELVALATSVREALAARALPFDPKPFQAHVTLARVRDDADATAARVIGDAVARARIASRRFDVTGLLLLESELSANGPRYTPRAAVPLGVGTG